MIIKEFYMTRKDGVNLYKTYSDKNVYIIKQGTDEKYEEAEQKIHQIREGTHPCR